MFEKFSGFHDLNSADRTRDSYQMVFLKFGLLKVDDEARVLERSVTCALGGSADR